MLTLKQIETFYWICRLGTFAAAAERMNTTQSAVSMRIQQLETRLGVSLFDRDARSNRLTPRGRQLFAYAQQFLSLQADLEASLAEPTRFSRTVRLGVSEMVVVSWLSSFLEAVNSTYPAVTIELDIDLTLNQMQKMKAGEIDLALLPDPADRSGFNIVPLGAVQFCWMASPRLKIPRRRIAPKELENWPLLTLTHRAHSHGLLRQWFESNDVQPRSRNLSNSVGVLLTLTFAGLGVSFLPVGPLTASHLKRGTLRILDTKPGIPPMQFVALHERKRSDPFIRELAKLAGQHSTFGQPS